MLGTFIIAAIAITQLSLYSLIVSKAGNNTKETVLPTLDRNAPSIPVLGPRLRQPHQRTGAFIYELAEGAPALTFINQEGIIKPRGEPGATIYSVTAIPGSKDHSEDYAYAYRPYSLLSDDELERFTTETVFSHDPQCTCCGSKPGPSVVTAQTRQTIENTVKGEISSGPDSQDTSNENLETSTTLGASRDSVVRPLRAAQWSLTLFDSLVLQTNHALSAFLVFLSLAAVRFLSRCFLSGDCKSALCNSLSPWDKEKSRASNLSALTSAESVEDLGETDSGLSVRSEDYFSGKDYTRECAESILIAEDPFGFENTFPGACDPKDVPLGLAAVGGNRSIISCCSRIIFNEDSGYLSESHDYPDSGAEFDSERQDGKTSLPQTSLRDPTLENTNKNEDVFRVSPNMAYHDVDVNRPEAQVVEETFGHISDCAVTGMINSEQLSASSTGTTSIDQEEENIISEDTQVETVGRLKLGIKPEIYHLEQPISEILPVTLAEVVSGYECKANLASSRITEYWQIREPNVCLQYVSDEHPTILSGLPSCAGTRNSLPQALVSSERDVPDRPRNAGHL